MSLILSGTNGVSDVDGTAATPAVRGSDTNTGIFFPAADTIAFAEGGVEVARFDSAGNLGIGTSSPGAKLDVSALSGSYAQLSGKSSAAVSADLRITRTSSSTGVVAAPNIYFSDGAAGNVNDFAIQVGSGNLQFWNYSASSWVERMRLDTSGNVGIGTSSPSNFGGANLQVQNSNIGSILWSNGTITGQLLASGSAEVTVGSRSNHPLRFGTNDTERARIDTSGNLLVGASSGNPGARLYLVGDSSPTFIQTVYDTRTDNNSGGGAIGFQRRVGTGSPSFVGSITTSTTSTAYNTSSDYRLKHDIQPMTGALAKVAALKPVTYKWNVDNSEGEGFIAHELAEVVPQCVTGEKDAVDADGNPVYQGIDTSFLVATLTAAIQELKAIVDAQAVEIAQLKGQA